MASLATSSGTAPHGFPSDKDPEVDAGGDRTGAGVVYGRDGVGRETYLGISRHWVQKDLSEKSSGEVDAKKVENTGMYTNTE